jgi:hypothetical protein
MKTQVAKNKKISSKLFLGLPQWNWHHRKTKVMNYTLNVDFTAKAFLLVGPDSKNKIEYLRFSLGCEQMCGLKEN